ncbi:TolB family protein [Polymorphobacter sp.]|uniref:TolB family protein n=1 Tax=Polymorphobacter sp. TaxID=1909290 RepID=UPI003F6EB1FB
MTTDKRLHPYRRVLRPGQASAVMLYDADAATLREVWRTEDMLVEAPNWTAPDELILNGDGLLWRLDLTSGALTAIDVPGLPYLNNDHVPAPGGGAMFVSGYDWHIHRLSLPDGRHEQVTQDHPDQPLRHFLHGVSFDGTELAFVGIAPRGDDPWGPANIYTMNSTGGPVQQLTFGDAPADGCEYSPDDRWIYFNTAALTGRAQIARLPRTGGTPERLTDDERVNWFPHLAPIGDLACYLSYPPGTTGHPADRPVEIRLVRAGRWTEAETVAAFNGGQGTINVNSWAADGRRFAFVAYPMAAS